jgi:predicted metalloprotease
MAEIDTQKTIYLFLHGRMDQKEKAENVLIAKGFSKEKIIIAQPSKVGEIGDYMAMLWRPPTPDQIKIQEITKVESVEPEGMIGLWKGVSQNDIDSIPFE